jgi:transposase
MIYNRGMHIVENKAKIGKKIYQSTLLRESYRENGKVKKRTIANLSNCSPDDIAAIKLALKHKGNLAALAPIQEAVTLKEGLSFGAVFVLYHAAKVLGVETALGTDIPGKLALWQVFARIIDQGSRLSAVRLARTHAVADVFGLEHRFDENDLYDNLDWLTQNQEQIERRLLLARRGGAKVTLFLYDVTSSYLEGDQNFFAKRGYNRDGKKGKMQIVIGLLCDEAGDPISVQVFPGNTPDPKTVADQVKKIAERFGCEEVILVGDRGMIKGTQIAEFPDNFRYITAITKPQIETMIKKGVFQYELFENELCEVIDGGIRYILRRNPLRAQEIKAGRESKFNSVAKLVVGLNCYLKEHPKASPAIAAKQVTAKIEKLKITEWLSVKADGRELRLEKDEAKLEQISLLDGCYAIKTDVAPETANKELIHERYKDLSQVEEAFRNMKTVHLEVRPVFVRIEESTVGHVEIVMLSYLIIKYLARMWAELDLTVAEGIKQLETLCEMEVTVNDKVTCKIPQPRESSQKLLDALGLTLPEILVPRKVKVDTKTKLPKQRKKP